MSVLSFMILLVLVSIGLVDHHIQIVVEQHLTIVEVVIHADMIADLVNLRFIRQHGVHWLLISGG
jgi:hypothetical protein